MGMPFFHSFLSWARALISLNDNPGGTSINMFPGRPISYCTLTASLISRFPGIRRICPSHRYRLCRIAPTRSNVLVRALASLCALCLVMCDRHRELHPFSVAIVFSVRRQASQPYVIKEQHAVAYIFSFSFMGSAGELNMLRRSPHLFIAIPVRRWTSCMCVPSAENIDPRYLKKKVFAS